MGRWPAIAAITTTEQQHWPDAQPVGGGHVITVRAGRHVAVQEGIGQQHAGGGELRRELRGEAADVSLDLSAVAASTLRLWLTSR
jgi:hypothetical protein